MDSRFRGDEREGILAQFAAHSLDAAKTPPTSHSSAGGVFVGFFPFDIVLHLSTGLTANQGGNFMFRPLTLFNRNRNTPALREDADPFFQFHREMNRLFDDFFTDFGAPSAFTDTGGSPAGAY